MYCLIVVVASLKASIHLFYIYLSLSISLGPDDISADCVLPLHFVKFQNVQNLTVSVQYVQL